MTTASPIHGGTFTTTSPLPTLTHLDPTPSNIQRIISIVAKAFHQTPLFLCFLAELDGLTPTTPQSAITQSRREEYYADGITRVATSPGAILVEAGNFSAIAIWEPPSFQGADFSASRKRYSAPSREWTARMKQTRVRYLGVPGQNPPVDQVDETTDLALRPFWHLGFLARDPDVEKVPGAISAVLTPFLERARNDGVPAWLEATSEYGVRLYTHFGFRLVETITVGRGKYGPDGWFEEGGPGAKGFCLIYDGHMADRVD